MALQSATAATASMNTTTTNFGETSGSRKPLPWSHLSMSALLLSAEGASLTLCIALLQVPSLSNVIEHNTMPAPQRKLVLLWLFSAAMLPLVGAALALSIKTTASTVRLIRRVADLAAPLTVAGALPALFNYTPWRQQQLP